MVDVMYRTIPTGSSLYRRLQQHEEALNILVSRIVMHGCGVFGFFEIEPEQVDEIIEGEIIEPHPNIFPSKEETNRIINDFRSELNQMRQEYPGIEAREILVENSIDEIEKCLVQQFAEIQVQNAEETVKQLLFGDRYLAPNLLPPEDETLGLISREVVREGGRLLRLVDPETLYTGDDNWDQWDLDHLKQLRNLYLAADEMDEEILVGVA